MLKRVLNLFRNGHEDFLTQLQSSYKGDINMIKFTRVYKEKATGAVKTQSVTVNPEFVLSVRPSNRLEGQRSIIVVAGGLTYDLADTYKEVVKAIAA